MTNQKKHDIIKSWKASNSNLKIELYGIGNKPEKPTCHGVRMTGAAICYNIAIY
nr:MAG TPA: hypothetical protein [Herelleviridae sp.]